MKHGIITDFKDKSYPHIILENLEDAAIYFAMDDQVKAQHSANFWMGFKSQSFWATMSDYYVHESESHNYMGCFLGLKCDFRESTSLMEFCNMSDSLISDIHKSMYRYIKEGYLIRINSKGGYCWIKDTSDYKDLVDIDQHQLYNFIINGGLNNDLKITAKSIVIENDNYYPKEVIEAYATAFKAPKEDLQVITSFKQKTLIFTSNEFYSLFKDGIKNYGLTNIIFETTGQDQKQIRDIKKLFESLATESNPLNIFIRVSRYKESQFKKLFETTSKHININFLLR